MLTMNLLSFCQHTRVSDLYNFCLYMLIFAVDKIEYFASWAALETAKLHASATHVTGYSVQHCAITNCELFHINVQCIGYYNTHTRSDCHPGKLR